MELVTAKRPLWWTQWEMLDQIRQSETCPWIRCKERQTNLQTQLFSLSSCTSCYFSNESCLAIGITRLFGHTNRQLIRGLLAPQRGEEHGARQMNCSGDILWNCTHTLKHTTLSPGAGSCHQTAPLFSPRGGCASFWAPPSECWRLSPLLVRVEQCEKSLCPIALIIQNQQHKKISANI